MNKILLLALLPILLFSQKGFGAEDVGPLWTKSYNSGPNSSDSGKGMVLDSNGNIYVTGYVAGQGSDIWTRKYDRDGAEVWTKTFNGADNGNDKGNGVAVDSSGNVYVVGSTYSITPTWDYENIWLRKYDTNGNELWTKTFDGPASNMDVGKAIVLDSSGNIYLTGFQSETRGSYVEWHLFAMKCDSSGNPIWTKIYNNVGSSKDEGNGITVDSSGNVYVTGYESIAMQSRNVLTIKYDSSGNELWTKTYDGGNSSEDEGNGIALDSIGNVYVIGFKTAALNYQNIWIRKYDNSGNIVWTAINTYGANNEDTGQGITLDATGNLYVTGRNGDDVWVCKLNSSGDVIWVKTYGGTAINIDVGNAIAVDSLGNVYVAGYETVTGESENILVRKYMNLYPSTYAYLKIIGGKEGFVNPAKGEVANFVYKSDISGTVIFKIFNMKGELVKTATASASGLTQSDSFNYDCKNEDGNYLSSGIYIVKAEGPGLSLVKKIAVIR